jgi:phosphopantothenoylcysteine decarboxylase/phosphopantothenate--cysteine ligase
MEHIELADYKRSDLIIVYPSTANTVGKLANGIDDTPISTVLTVAFGSKTPILMGLAMHESMYENAAVRKNIQFLKKKVDFVSPQMIEGKAKAPEPEDILDFVLTKFGQSKKLKGKKILMTAGPTVEKIDPVRVMTNTSTGKTGTLLASELISAGAKVTLVYGPGTAVPPKGAKVIHVRTVTEMFNAVKKELRKKFDVVVLAAAASDFIPKNSNTKIKSNKNTVIKLNRAPKIIDHIKKLHKGILVGFKAEANVSKKELVSRAKKKLKESHADLMIANDIGSGYNNSDYNEVFLVDSKNVIKTGRKTKGKIAKIIRKSIEKNLI